MFDSTQGAARELLPARERVDQEALEKMLAAGTVIVDSRRNRFLPFDGRFLTARDLVREQVYFLSRQADLGRAVGAGVVHGLTVGAGPTATSIRISAGHGLTGAGELVLLSGPLTAELSNIADIQRLDSAFGLARTPREPARNRSGLFILGLRPVEFTANPIAQYPTSLTGDRSVHDGDIVEAVALTLIPYIDEGADADLDKRRARMAREIFVGGAKRAAPPSILPVAMIGLDRGVIRWIDPFMVRREVGAEQEDILGLGFAPRVLREAHLLQYDHHLTDIMRLRAATSLRFAASDHFYALPPAGRMPAAAIDPRDFSQIYFPPEVDAELSIIPQDEVNALLEESLLLPPIDLTLSGDEQESTSVMVLIPVQRERVNGLRAKLATFVRPLKPAAPGLVAKRKPLESLRALTLLPLSRPIITAEVGVEATWREALASTTTVWYVRRRNLQYKSDLVGIAVRAFGQEFQSENDVDTLLATFGLRTRFNRLRSAASARASAEMISLLSAPKFSASKLLAEGAITEIEASKVTVEGQERLDRAAVVKVSDRFADPHLGEGIARLETANPEIKTNEKAIKAIALAGVTPELDRVGRLLKDADVAAFAKDLAGTAKKDRAAENVRNLVNKKLEEIGR